MIIYRDKLILDESELSVDALVSDVISDKNTLSSIDNHYSTYYIPSKERPEVVWVDQYVDHIYDLVETNFFPRSKVKMNFWTQVYKGTGHGKHDHFRYNIPLSFVHFIRPSRKECFHFILGDKKEYPKQEAGDFIIFPSWAKHAIDPCPEDEYRVSIAGNIILNSYIGDELAFYYVPASGRTDVVEILNLDDERVTGGHQTHDHDHDHPHSH